MVSPQAPKYWGNYLQLIRYMSANSSDPNVLHHAMNSFVVSDIFMDKTIPCASGRIEVFAGTPGNIPFHDSIKLGEFKAVITSDGSKTSDINLCSVTQLNKREDNIKIKDVLSDSGIHRLSGLISPKPVTDKLVVSVQNDQFIFTLNDTKISTIKRSELVNTLDIANPSARINIFHHNNVEYTNLTVCHGFDGEAIASHLEAGNLRMGSVLQFTKSGGISQTVNLRMSKKIFMNVASFHRDIDSNDLYFMNDDVGFNAIPLSTI